MQDEISKIVHLYGFVTIGDMEILSKIKLFGSRNEYDKAIFHVESLIFKSSRFFRRFLIFRES